jgi:hypothetical protein
VRILYNATKAMSLPISATIPIDRLKRLEFLLGEFSGLETLYPPNESPIQFEAHITGEWEACDRFFQLEFYADVPTLGTEILRILITYSVSRECYRMWCFAASQEEPVHMTGSFDEHGSLVFLSDPTDMVWGMQRLRYTFNSDRSGAIQLLGERWEPDGYAKYCAVVFRLNEVSV